VDKSDKDLAMADSGSAELQRITRLAAGPIDANDNIKSAIARAARWQGTRPPMRSSRTLW
jgi:hypothetical protein